MSELFLVLGWGIAQWRKAIEYYNQCQPPEDLFDRPVHCIVQDVCQGGRADGWLKVQKYWKDRRIDEPGEVKILLPGETS